MQISSPTLFRSLSPLLPSPKGRVLIVDDEENVTVLLQRSLARLGPDLEVWVANSGAQALELLNGKWFDLLITDYRMPYMNGLELTEAVRRCHPGIQIIWMTAYPSPQIAELADRLAVAYYLVKPFSSRDLREVVRELLTLPGGERNRNSCC